MTRNAISTIKGNIITIVLITLSLCVSKSNAENNFVTVSLTKGVTVDLPRNWSVMSDNDRITLDAWRESVLESHNLSEEKSEVPFSAHYFDNSGGAAATFSIRFYPNLTITKSESIAADSTFIKELDIGIKNNFIKGVTASGGHVINWLGTTKKSINNSVYFISESRQLSPKGIGFKGILVRHFNAEKSFTIIISYQEDQEYFLKPICNKIIGSIQN